VSSVKPLREFEYMDWVMIDYGEVFDKRRSFPNPKGMARALESDFPSEKQAEDSYDLKTTGEIFQKLFGDDEVDPKHIAEVKRIIGNPCGEKGVGQTFVIPLLHKLSRTEGIPVVKKV
jgi:hypothetical protein